MFTHTSSFTIKLQALKLKMEEQAAKLDALAAENNESLLASLRYVAGLR